MEFIKRFLKTTALVVLLGRNCNGQSSGRCQNAPCIAPKECKVGYYHQKQWMSTPFPLCCYSTVEGYKSSYTSPRERLEELDCRFRNVENILRTEARQDVRILDLSFNRLQRKGQRLRDRLLQYFPQIKALRITTSQLDNVPTNFLWENVDLEHLDLSINLLRELPADLFSNCTELTKVDLSWNRISALPKDLFKNTPKIQELQLDRNRLKYLTSEVFEYTPLLEYLDVAENRALECISKNLLQHTPEITYVGLERTGYTLQRQLRQEFCNNYYCRLNIQNLKRFLRVYRSTRYFRRRLIGATDPCEED